MNKPLVYGHRGADIEAPENTLPSFRLAKEIGAYGIEMDIHTTKDNEIIVMHDEFLDRTTNGNGWVHNYTLEQIKKLDAGQKFDKRFKGTKIPTLNEVFDAVGDIHYYIEIKHGSNYYPNIEEKLLNLIDDHGLKNNVQIISFDFDSLSKIRQLDKTISIGPLFSNPISWFIPISKKLNADWIQPSISFLDKASVDLAHDNKLKVAVWTVDTEELVNLSVKSGVDSITTNDPRKVIKILNEMK